MSLLEQQKLLDQLCDLMHRSAESGYESLKCRFEYIRDDQTGGISTGARFSYAKDGENRPAHLLFPDRGILTKVLPELHSLTMQHTGGDWKAVSVEISAQGQATTTFEYE